MPSVHVFSHGRHGRNSFRVFRVFRENYLMKSNFV
jgi:hypothetical protein